MNARAVKWISVYVICEKLTRCKIRSYGVFNTIYSINYDQVYHKNNLVNLIMYDKDGYK